MTMRAMRLNETGGRLVEETLAVPEPGPGQVLVRVAACAVNFADTLMVKGRYQETPDLPFSPGLEVAGTVEALGAGVEGPAHGTRVAALPGHGGMAEYVLAPAATVVPVPDAMDMRAAAGLQVAYGTAHVALWHRAGLKPGERLVVTGAAGGAGLAAVAVGALMGAEVVAVARGEARLETVRAVGAAHAIDPTAGDLREALLALGGVDVVYETVGGEMWKACLRAARPEARLLPIGFAGGEVPQIPANILLVKNLDVIGFYWGAYYRFRPEVLVESFRTLIGWVEDGRLTPEVGHVLPLSEANEALALIAGRRATGKVILEP